MNERPEREAYFPKVKSPAWVAAAVVALVLGREIPETGNPRDLREHLTDSLRSQSEAQGGDRICSRTSQWQTWDVKPSQVLMQRGMNGRICPNHDSFPEEAVSS